MCTHVETFKAAGGETEFSAILSYLCNRTLVAKLPMPSCATCTTLTSVVACAQCTFIGCFGSSCEGHLRQHFQETGHYLGVDCAHHTIYCNECGQHVYDARLNDVALQEKKRAAFSSLQILDPAPGRVLHEDWRPGKREAEELQTKAKRVCRPTAGVRGLYNLGNTCFMNCILQSFLHNPLLRNYFTGAIHSADACSTKASGAVCLGCELVDFFVQMFAMSNDPVSPHRFLQSVWKHANHLAGYEQQDAHEFFISVLDGIHAGCANDPASAASPLSSPLASQQPGFFPTRLATGAEALRREDCNCIVHRVFSGTLRSDVTCLRCHNTSSRRDPFLDISLDVGLVAETTLNDRSPTLVDCLTRFTTVEQLGSDAMISCSKCNSKQESEKRLSLDALPTVMSFHIKRFEHSNGTSSAKVDTHVDFPLTLDMAPYTSAEIERQGNGGKSTKRSPSYLYDLFAVVNHHGVLHSGHYTCFVWHGGAESWFKIDDVEVTKATTADVLASEGYLLFYMKRHMEYFQASS